MIGKLPYAYTFAKKVQNYNKEVFPKKNDYDNDLDEEPYKEEEYQRVLKVREAMKCKTYRDEHDTYLKLDVCLLADVFEYF